MRQLQKVVMCGETELFRLTILDKIDDGTVKERAGPKKYLDS